MSILSQARNTKYGVIRQQESDCLKVPPEGWLYSMYKGYYFSIASHWGYCWDEVAG